MKSCVIYRTKKKTKFRLPFWLLRGSRPKSARASRPHLAHTVPDFIQFGSLSAAISDVLNSFMKNLFNVKSSEFIDFFI